MSVAAVSQSEGKDVCSSDGSKRKAAISPPGSFTFSRKGEVWNMTAVWLNNAGMP